MHVWIYIYIYIKIIIYTSIWIHFYAHMYVHIYISTCTSLNTLIRALDIFLYWCVCAGVGSTCVFAFTHGRSKRVRRPRHCWDQGLSLTLHAHSTPGSWPPSRGGKWCRWHHVYPNVFVVAAARQDAQTTRRIAVRLHFPSECRWLVVVSSFAIFASLAPG